MPDTALITKILAKYDLIYSHISPPQSGYRNQTYPVVLQDGQTINLILYKTEPGILEKIRNANQVGSFLAERGFPARQTTDKRILCIQPKVDFAKIGPSIKQEITGSSDQGNERLTNRTAKYSALYNYLPGETIPWEAYTMQHLKLLGAAMSNMHALLVEFPGDLQNVAYECLALDKRMRRYFADPGVTTSLQAKLGLNIKDIDFSNTLHLGSKLPNQQALHMDFVRGNILFSEGVATDYPRILTAAAHNPAIGADHNREEQSGHTQLAISGVIDFEKTAYGHPVFDIARTLAFLLVDCKFKTEQKIRKYFLVSGYNKRGVAQYNLAKLEDVDLLEELINFFLLHDFYKFLRHNPYEALTLNEHFVRTRDLLLSRLVIE
jgi:Ser/Thr protein kinase RdoA (MazF antagonist)